MTHLEELGELKNPKISSGIEPATFRFAAQCLSPLRNAVYSCSKPKKTHNIILLVLLLLLVG
jgi:hypothetical protein